MYALGWTQHTVGVQNIRLSSLIQLLLGNIGGWRAAASMLCAASPVMQGSTDHALLYNNLPGYHATPQAVWQTWATTPRPQRLLLRCQ